VVYIPLRQEFHSNLAQEEHQVVHSWDKKIKQTYPGPHQYLRYPPKHLSIKLMECGRPTNDRMHHHQWEQAGHLVVDTGLSQ